MFILKVMLSITLIIGTTTVIEKMCMEERWMYLWKGKIRWHSESCMCQTPKNLLHGNHGVFTLQAEILFSGNCHLAIKLMFLISIILFADHL